MSVSEYQFKTVTFERKKWLIHPFCAEDLKRFDEIARQIFEIFSDEKTICFTPEKKLLSLEDAHSWLQRAILNFHTGRSYVHFISEKNTGKVVGVIEILAPKFTKEYYRLDDYPYFIEFYLMRQAQGRMLMSNLLPEVIASLRHQGIFSIAAIVNRKNNASIRVLAKAGFRYETKFDVYQDLFVVE